MRRLLLIAPSFFGYREEIASEFRRQGLEVDIASERPDEGIWFKSLYKLNPELVRGAVEKHSAAIGRKIQTGNHDAVLFVGGMTIPFNREQMTRIRCAAACPLAIYFWDAFANCPCITASLDLFDAVISFESEAFPDLVHLPLFYSPVFEQASKVPLSSVEFDACFVGSVHQPDKFHAVVEIVDALRQDGLNVKTHYYMPSRSALALRRLQDPLYRRKDISFTFDSLGRPELSDIYSRCSCVIDSPQGGQLGLTMRTIEALGSGRNLITANRAVTSYDFYEYGDVFVWGHDSSDVSAFARCRKHKTPDNVRHRYSLESWTGSLIDCLGAL